MKDSIFTSTQFTATQITDRALRRRIDGYLVSAKLKRKGLSAHSLRATSATLLMENGAGLIEIQKHLNHSSPEVTIKYIARMDKITQRTAEKVAIKL